MSGNMVLTTFLKCAVMAGCFLNNLCQGIEWYYGNLSTYTNSYFRIAIGPSAYDVNPDWLLSTYLIFFVLGILTLDFVASKVDIRLVQIIDTVFLSVGQCVTYFSVQHSVGLVLLTFMICGGYTCGSICMVTLKDATAIMPNRVGLATAIASIPVTLGAVVYNYVITYYINKDNLTPDARVDDMTYFSQYEILRNVPGVFIVLGVSSLVILIVGYVMEHLPFAILKRTDESFQQEATEHTQLTKKDSEDLKGSHPIDYVQPSSRQESCSNSCQNDNAQSQCLNEDPGPNLKPSEVLRSKSMYQLIFAASVLTFSSLLNVNYYKAFGQLWIADDTFLALVGSFTAVSNTILRLAVGIVLDAIGIKNTFILALSVNTILLPWWFITPQYSRWLYFVCCQALIGIQGTMFILLPSATLNLYGPRYYATNYGMVMVATVITSLLCPSLFSFLLVNYGWFSMVLTGSGFSVLGFLSFVVFMPADRIKT